MPVHRETLRREGAHGSAGFSLVELLVAIVVSSVVMVGMLTILIAENRRVSQERELSDTWLTLRSAAEVIAYDLRQASASGGDLSTLTDTSFTVRSRRGSGVICSVSLTGYGLTNVTGEFGAELGDSIQVMTVEQTPAWRNLDVSAVGTPGLVGPASCTWTGSAPPTQGLLLVGTSGELANVTVGSPIHAYRLTQYGIMTSGGRRWLGRKVAGAAQWEIVTGPLREDGLRLTYYTSAGGTTTTAAQVAAVRIALRSESFGRTNQRKVMQDTLSVRIQLRN
jgi:prepilin-type N-terminal cleavage/methylation domain-containing protein